MHNKAISVSCVSHSFRCNVHVFARDSRFSRLEGEPKPHGMLMFVFLASDKIFVIHVMRFGGNNESIHKIAAVAAKRFCNTQKIQIPEQKQWELYFK